MEDESTTTTTTVVPEDTTTTTTTVAPDIQTQDGAGESKPMDEGESTTTTTTVDPNPAHEVEAPAGVNPAGSASPAVSNPKNDPTLNNVQQTAEERMADARQTAMDNHARATGSSTELSPEEQV